MFLKNIAICLWLNNFDFHPIKKLHCVINLLNIFKSKKATIVLKVIRYGVCEMYT